MAREALDALTKELRRWRPGKLVAVVEGERRDIALPGSRRRRWEMVARTVLALDWSRLELLDAKGALLHTVEAEVADDDGADGVADVERVLGKAPGGLDREHGLLLLMLKAQEVSLKHQAVAMSTLTDGYRSLAETVFGRLAQLEATFGKTLQLAHDSAQRVAQSSGDADPNDELMLKLLEKWQGGGFDEKKLEGVVERIGRKLTGGLDDKKPAPPNGAAKGG